jgi:phosphate/phosphite/phosphonate ABC transporter binding protein
VRGSRASYAFGIVRSLESSSTRAKLGEVCDHLSRALGVVVFPHVSVAYRELADLLDRGQLGFAWIPPLLALELEDRKHVIPVALPVRRGTTHYHAAIITRRGALKTLDDLHGARVAWVDRSSAAGYVVPRMHLVGAGFDVQTLFSSELFLHTHDAVVDAVLSGRADAGATFCTVDPRNNRVLQAGWTAPDGTAQKPVEVLALAGPIPNDGVFAATSVPAELRNKLLEIFLAPDAALREALDAVLRAETFRAATAIHYDPLRRLIKAAQERSNAPPSSRR